MKFLCGLKSLAYESLIRRWQQLDWLKPLAILKREGITISKGKTVNLEPDSPHKIF